MVLPRLPRRRVVAPHAEAALRAVLAVALTPEQAAVVGGHHAWTASRLCSSSAYALAASRALGCEVAWRCARFLVERRLGEQARRPVPAGAPRLKELLAAPELLPAAERAALMWRLLCADLRPFEASRV